MVGASASEALACRQTFGDYEDASTDEILIDDTPDRAQLMQTTADEDYLRWLFQPIEDGVWQAFEGPNNTLGLDSRCEPPCPVLPVPH